MDAELLERLESEHRMVEQLFAELEEATEAEQQQPLVDQLEQALSKHMRVEESEVYPELAKIDGEMEEEAETEHQLGRDGLDKLRQMVGEPGFGAAVAMLKAGIEHHVEEEEGEVFPKLRRELGLADSSEATKSELYEQAKQAGIEGRSTMTKDELAASLSDPK
jgi:hemerythrin superfamily protein